MIYQRYITRRFGPEAQVNLVRAKTIIEDYAKQGYTLTLRQLYYQFVSRAWLPNTERNYKNLGNLVNDGRLAGVLPWDGIEDRGRSCSQWMIEEDEREVFNGIEHQFALDVWKRQPTYLEVWVEKDALRGVLERPARKWRIPYMGCKGYLSQSEAWRSANRFKEARDRGQDCVLLHLGDHDPSGIDMTRDNGERFNIFLGEGEVEVQRLALNMNQVEQYNPPPNPAKMTDSRANDYVALYGDSSWELDALEPKVIDKLIDDAIKQHVDLDTFNATVREERERRRPLAKVYEHWEDVAEFLQGL